MGCIISQTKCLHKSDCLLAADSTNKVRFMPAKPLSPDQLEDAKRLKAIFRGWQARRNIDHLPWSQEHCADLLGLGQSAMNQYLNGRIPLNPSAASRFAQVLGVGVETFSPDIAQKLESMSLGLSQQPSDKEHQWPFPEVDPRKVAALDQASRLRLEGAILMAASQLQLDIRK